MGNQTSAGGNKTTRATCTTAFTTGKLDITREQRAILIAIDMWILLINLCANLLSIYALVKSQQIKKRPSISLLVYLCTSDCCFAVTAQTLFAIKIFHPELPCLFDLIVEFSSSVLADLSLCLVVLIAISRYIHTRHMIRVKQIITHTRVNMAVTLAFVVATSMSLISLLANSKGDVDAYLQTEIFQTFIGVMLIVLVVVIYRRTELVAKRRKAVSKYIMHHTAYSEKVLRKIMLSTLCTLLPLRIPFFCSTVVKAVVSDRNGRRLSWWMQLTHLGCYALFCLNAGANALIFLYNNRNASKLIKFQWEQLTILAGIRKPGSAVRPMPEEGVIPPLVQPVVTTGWYDRYVPTEAPTTLSTAVIGKKVWRDERQRKRMKRKRRKLLEKRRLMEENKANQKEKASVKEVPQVPRQKKLGWQLLGPNDRSTTEFFRAKARYEPREATIQTGSINFPFLDEDLCPPERKQPIKSKKIILLSGLNKTILKRTEELSSDKISAGRSWSNIKSNMRKQLSLRFGPKKSSMKTATSQAIISATASANFGEKMEYWIKTIGFPFQT